MFNIVIPILLVILFIYCSFSVIYIFTLSFFAKLFYNNKQKVHIAEKAVKKIAILVPAYKEDSIILSTAKNLLLLDYPTELFDIYILADSFKENTIEKVKQLPLHLFEVSFENSTKTKSLNEAFKRIEDNYDIALICDADNMLASDFLRILNNEFLNGALAVQGRRVAKNLDSSFAILDACSEAINNNIFRKGTNAIGLSSAVIGSGMAFDFVMVKKILSEISAVGGFDKILQLKITEQGIKIKYLENALIFDEKVESSHAFKQQRKRWISSQFIYLKQFFSKAFEQLLKGNLSYFNLAVASNLVLPRAFLLIILPALVLVSFIYSNLWGIAALSLLLIYLVSLIMALPAGFINKELFYAVQKLPKAILVMVSTLFQLKKANQTFIHTVHTKTEISNSLFKDHGQ